VTSVRCDSFSVKRSWICCDRATLFAAGALGFGTAVSLPQPWQLKLIPAAARLTTSDVLQCWQQKKMSGSEAAFGAERFAVSVCMWT